MKREGGFRLSLGIVGRLVGWGLVVDAVLGLLYLPLAELIFQALYGGANNDPAMAGAMTTGTGTLFQLLFLFGTQGLLGGALVGFLGGVTAGVVLAVGSRRAAPGQGDAHRYRQVLSLSSAFAGTLPALVLLTIIQPPRIFDYLGGAWSVLGWVLFTVIPLCLVFGAAWWASHRVITWLENQPGELHPSYQ